MIKGSAINICNAVFAKNGNQVSVDSADVVAVNGFAVSILDLLFHALHSNSRNIAKASRYYRKIIAP